MVAFFFAIACCFFCTISNVIYGICCTTVQRSTTGTGTTGNNAEIRNGESNQVDIPGVIYLNQDVPEIQFRPWHPTEDPGAGNSSTLLSNQN